MVSASIMLLQLVSILPVLVSAVTHDIKVGDGGLKFDPDSVTAAKGDILRFRFYPDEHNVAQSAFDKPCQPLDNGIFSGDQEVDEGKMSDMTFDVTVNNTDPIWLYCSEERHCNSGMVMVVNPPSSGNTLDEYKKAAESANPSSPSAVAGGVYAVASGSASASSGESSMSMTSGMSSSMASTMASMSMTATAAASAATTTGAADHLRAGEAGWMVALGLGGAAIAGML